MNLLINNKKLIIYNLNYLKKYYCTRYSSKHEWVTLDGNKGKLGLTNHGHQLLGGEILYVEVPVVGQYKKDESIGSIESVKSISEIYCPLDITIKQVNNELKGSPDSLNSDCWIVAFESNDKETFNNLMTEKQYEEFIINENNNNNNNNKK